jgi:4-diphosphocytidyl-2-C-methyl-D-erythritol kinase
MISFPNAKINLGLRVHKKRVDGFHEIESCFHPIHWNDILEIAESNEEKFTFSGISIPGLQEDNLCWKAYKRIKEEYQIPAVHIHLHKVIPMGAGIGGSIYYQNPK